MSHYFELLKDVPEGFESGKSYCRNQEDDGYFVVQAGWFELGYAGQYDSRSASLMFELGTPGNPVVVYNTYVDD